MGPEERWSAFPIKDQADLTWALVKAVESGLLKGCTEIDHALIKTIISELGTNIIKYAKRGVISVKREEAEGAVDIHIGASDRGPGIADVELAMQDRYTTGTSLGLGLPSVKRLADDFSITSALGQGTQVLVRKRIRRPLRRTTAADHLSSVLQAKVSRHAPLLSRSNAIYEAAAYARPVPSEWVCGDIALLQEVGDHLLLALVDVSGHGKHASDLAGQISQHLALYPAIDPHELMGSLHGLLRGTQGAAAALLHVHLKTGQAEFCAVGNVSACRVNGLPWKPISKDGVLGQRLPTLLRQSTQLRNGDMILMWTDGVSELAARRYAAKNTYQAPEKLAVDLVTALGRPFDDASCMVLKWIA